jgi:hypothetical protein
LSRAYLHGGDVERTHSMSLSKGFWDGQA